MDLILKECFGEECCLTIGNVASHSQCLFLRFITGKLTRGGFFPDNLVMIQWWFFMCYYNWIKVSR